MCVPKHNSYLLRLNSIGRAYKSLEVCDWSIPETRDQCSSSSPEIVTPNVMQDKYPDGHPLCTARLSLVPMPACQQGPNRPHPARTARPSHIHL